MKNKRIIAILLVFFALLNLAACDTGDGERSSTTDETSRSTVESTTESKSDVDGDSEDTPSREGTVKDTEKEPVESSGEGSVDTPIESSGEGDTPAESTAADLPDETEQRAETTVDNCTDAPENSIPEYSRGLDFIMNSEDATVTVSGLNIRVGKGETLAFGDTDMQFSLCANKANDEHMLIRSIFNDPLGSVYSVPIIVDGYWYFGGER